LVWSRLAPSTESTGVNIHGDDSEWVTWPSTARELAFGVTLAVEADNMELLAHVE